MRSSEALSTLKSSGELKTGMEAHARTTVRAVVAALVLHALLLGLYASKYGRVVFAGGCGGIRVRWLAPATSPIAFERLHHVAGAVLP
jgi:hypothetical protein